jgi:predicted nucleic acid-binding protein
LSELRKGKRCDPHLTAWFATISEDEIFLSVLTIGELRRGIENIHRRDSRSAASLNSWLRETIANFHDRILPIDQDIAQEWGRMNVPNPLPVIDGLLAATAKIRGLILVTRNTKDIARSGVPTLNPFVA